MRSPAGTWCGRFALVAIVGLLAVRSPVAAQEISEPAPQQATTTSDATIPTDNLLVILRPLTKDDLQIELRAWIDLLIAKIRESRDTELELKALAENESGDQLTEQLVALRTDEVALAERARIVLDALKTKGGDVQTSEQFLNAVSDISETTDATAYWAAIVAEATNWMSRDDGGKYWMKRSLVALAILLVFWVMSKFAGRIAARTLSRHEGASNLLENFARRTAGGVVFVIGVLMAIA
jgi:hypothetical protein